MLDRESGSGEQRTIALARIVFDLTQRFDSFRNANEIFDAVTEGLQSLVPFDRTAIVLFYYKGNEVEHRYSRGDPLVFRQAESATVIQVERLYTLAEPLLYDITEVPRFAGDADRYEQGYRQGAVSPLIIDRESVGMFTIMSKTPHRWDDSDLWILSSLGGALGTMLAATNVRHETVQRQREAEFIAELGYILSSRHEGDDLFELAAEHISRAFGCPVAFYLNVQGRPSFKAAAAQLDGDLHHDDGSRFARMIAANLAQFDDNPVSRVLQPTYGSEVHETRVHEGHDEEFSDVLLRELLDYGTKSLLTVPIIWNGQPIAALVGAQTARPQETPLIAPSRHRQMLKRVAEYIAPVIQSSLLQEDLTRALNESEVLRRILSDTSSREDPAEALDIVVRAAQMLYGADYVAIGQRRRGKDTLEWLLSVGTLGINPELLPMLSVVSPALGLSLERLTPVIVRDFPHDPPLDADNYPVHLHEHLRSSLCAPFEVAEGTRGLLLIGFRSPHLFDAADIRFARSLAQGVASSLLRGHVE